MIVLQAREATIDVIDFLVSALVSVSRLLLAPVRQGGEGRDAAGYRSQKLLPKIYADCDLENSHFNPRTTLQYIIYQNSESCIKCLYSSVGRALNFGLGGPRFNSLLWQLSFFFVIGKEIKVS